MRQTSLEEIKNTALSFKAQGYKWHFHILSPKCMFNKKPSFAFVLECPAQNQSYVHYSDKPAKDLGKELVELLYDNKILDGKATSGGRQPSPTAQKIIQKANALHAQNKPWHHHMLFPDCVFNKHSPKWVITFEDETSREMLESPTSNNPVNDLKQLEVIFYNEK